MAVPAYRNTTDNEGSRGRRRTPHAGRMLGAVAFLSSAVLVWLLATPSGSWRPAQTAAILAALMLGSAALLLQPWRPWFHPGALAVATCVILLVLHPLGRQVYDDYSGGVLQIHDPQPNLVAAGCLASLGAIMLLIGIRLRAGPAHSSREWPLVRATSQRGTSVQTLIDVTLVIFVTTCIFILAQRVGGLTALFSGRTDETSRFLQGTSGYLYLSPYLLVAPSAIRLLQCPRWLSLSGLWGMTMLLISQSLAIGGGNRVSLIPAAVSVLMLSWLRTRSIRRPAALVTLLVIAALALIVLPRVARQANDPYYQQDNRNTFSAVASDVLVGNDTAMLDNFAVLIGFENGQIERAWGRNYVGALGNPSQGSFGTPSHEVLTRRSTRRFSRHRSGIVMDFRSHSLPRPTTTSASLVSWSFRFWWVWGSEPFTDVCSSLRAPSPSLRAY